MFHVLTDFHHRAARLMSQHKRRFHDKITDRSRFIVVQVTAADPHILQLHQHLVVLHLRNLPLLKTDLADIQHHRSLHCSLHCKPSFKSFPVFLSFTRTLLNSFIMLIIIILY